MECSGYPGFNLTAKRRLEWWKLEPSGVTGGCLDNWAALECRNMGIAMHSFPPPPCFDFPS